MKANKIFNKKHTYSFLALSVMAVCGQASATIYEKNESIWGQATSYESWLTPNEKSEYFSDGNIVDITSGNISTNKEYALLAFNLGTINVIDTNINISSIRDGAANAVGATTVSRFDSTNNLTAFTDGGTINIGKAGVTQNINISAKSTNSDAIGIRTMRSVNDPNKAEGIYAKPSFVNIEGENLNINAHSDKGYAVGIWAQNNTGEKGNESTVNINAKNTVIDVTTGITEADASGEYLNIGVVAYSGAKVYLNNNVTINAGTAISTRGGSVIEINKNGNGTVKINGDINFNYN